MNTMAKLQTPREACIAALVCLVYGGNIEDARELLADQGVTVAIDPKGGIAYTAQVRTSARKKYEATAGCATDALTGALRESLKAKEAGE